MDRPFERFAERIRIPAAAVLAAHGAIHLMGVVLLWHVAQPGGLHYSDMHPAPSSAAGFVVGPLRPVTAGVSAAGIVVDAAVIACVAAAYVRRAHLHSRPTA